MTTTRLQTFDGNIGIGTNDPGSYRLNVVGNLKADSLVINGVTNSQVPIGLIAPWAGTVATIPTGWALCNGQSVIRSDNGASITTPDLRSKFVRGAVGDNPSPEYPGQSGGSNTVSVTSAHMTSHTHTFTTASATAPHSHPTGNNSTPHTHGGDIGDDTVAHNHGATSTVNAPHSHTFQQNSTPHSHNNSPTTGFANAPHTHNSNSTDCPHAHYYGNYVASPGSGFLPNFSRIANSPGTPANTGQSYGPHAHPVEANPFTHNHGVSQSNAPHNHIINSNPMAHNHGNSGNTNIPHSHTIQQSSPTLQHSHEVPTVTVAHSHPGSNTDATGQVSPAAITITNPYYVLAYIMKY